jgi:hypothetical protein
MLSERRSRSRRAIRPGRPGEPEFPQPQVSASVPPPLPALPSRIALSRIRGRKRVLFRNAGTPRTMRRARLPLQERCQTGELLPGWISFGHWTNT